MRRVIGVAAFVISAGSLAGCGAGSGGDVVVTAQVDTVAGVERWLYPGMEGPVLRGAIDSITLIGGALEDDDAYQFNQVTGMGLVGDAAGNLYVLDRMGTRVLKYDSRGQYLGRYGRSGSGPGELGSPIGIAIGPGDSIWVADIGNWRYVIYPQDGGEARNLSFADGPAMPGVGFTFRPGGVLHDFRELRMMRRTMEGGRAGGPPPLPEESPRAVLRMTPEGTILDTLWLSRPPEPNVSQSGSAGNVVMVRMQRTFEPSLYWAAFSDGGIAVSDTADYILHLVDASGTVVRRIDRDLPARVVTEADKEQAREQLRERMRSGGGIRITVGGGRGGGGGQAAAAAAAMQEEQLRSMTFAPVVPRITGLRIDPADRLWVGVSLESAGETDRIDIYDRDGRLLAQLLGEPLPTTFFGPDLAARVVRDELEVEQILIYRLPESIPGSS
jgi:hypothetical protein